MNVNCPKAEQEEKEEEVKVEKEEMCRRLGGFIKLLVCGTKGS